MVPTIPYRIARFSAFGFLGVAATIFALELLFRILPVSTAAHTGYYFDPVILTYPAHHSFTASTGWDLQNAHSLHTNNYGFVADHDFAPGVNAVALIGDSFVESSMLAPRARLAAQLETRLGQRPVFAMGGPGSSLLDYAERIRFASQRFGVRDFVLLLEHGDVGQSLCGSGNVHGACLDSETFDPRIETQPAAGKLKGILRQFGVPQYLFSQLKLNPSTWPTLWRTKLGMVDSTVTHRDSMRVAPEATQSVLSQFFERVKPYPRDHLILVLTGTERAGDGRPDIVRDQLIESASRNGAIVLEPTPEIEQYGEDSGLSMEVSPTDQHMNGIAMAIIADRVAPLLSTTESPAQ
jgi:hypothetical protein